MKKQSLEIKNGASSNLCDIIALLNTLISKRKATPMRKSIRQQLAIVQPHFDHEHARELQAMSDLLDEVPEIVGLVHEDMIRDLLDPEAGREGITAEQVLRALISPTRAATEHSVDSASATALRQSPRSSATSKSSGPKHSKRSIVFFWVRPQRKGLKREERSGLTAPWSSRTSITPPIRPCCSIASECCVAWVKRQRRNSVSPSATTADGQRDGRWVSSTRRTRRSEPSTIATP
jgi:hypothetical protein